MGLYLWKVAWDFKLTGMTDWIGDIGLEGREATGRGMIVIFNSVKGGDLLELALTSGKGTLDES